MAIPSCRTFPTLAALAAALAGLAAPLLGQAQNAPPLSIPKPDRPEVAKATVQLDLDQLLIQNQVFPSAAPTDDIWEISANPGRMLVRVPVIPDAPKEAMEMDSSSVRLSGARFLCYQLVDPEDEKNKGSADPTAVNPIGEKSLPINVPRFAREIIIRPDKTVTWEMERTIFGGKVRDVDAPYTLKLNRDQLAKHEPERPRIDVTKDAETRRREAAEYREKALAYLKLKRDLTQIAEEFKGPTPPFIWAIFEIPATARDFSIESGETLDFKIPMGLLRDMQALAYPDRVVIQSGTTVPTVSTTRGTATRVAEDLIKLLQAENPHPYIARLTVSTFVKAGMLAEMEVGDSVYNALDQVLSLKDTKSAGMLTKELTLTRTGASLALMKKALSESLLDSAAQLESVKGMLTFAPGAVQLPEDMADRIGTIKTFLLDPNGPAPSSLMAIMFEQSAKNSIVLRALKDTVRFEGATGNRRDQLLVSVIEGAPTYALAQHWLDVYLLGGEEEMVQRTVYLLGNAKLQEKPAEPAEASSGAAEDSAADAQTPTAPPASPVSVDGATPPQSPPAPLLTARIPVPSTSHSIYKAIQINSPQIRAMAWRCMQFMEMKVEGQTVAPNTARWDQLLTGIAMAQTPTPVAVVEFMSRHRGEGVDTSLGQILIRADNDASAAAARELLSSGRRADQVLLGLKNTNDRFNFGARLYEHVTKGVPYPVGLLRDPSDKSPVADWFGKQLAAGRLPDGAEWVRAYRGSEDVLVEMVPLSDQHLSLGAVGALVMTVGGEATDVPEVSTALRKDKGATIPDLVKQWSTMRSGIFAGRLKQTPGKYSLVLAVPQSAKPGEPPNWSDMPLGDVTVGIEGAAAKVGDALGAIPSDGTLAIRLTKADFAKLPEGEKITELPLDASVQQADFKPLSNGSWLAMLNLQDGRMVELRLKKAGS